AVIRQKATLAELPVVVPALIGEAWEWLKAKGLPGGRGVAVYRDGGLEAGNETDALFAGDGRVIRAETPSGPAAHATLTGPYSGLPDAHAAVRAWCAANGFALAGACWEVYGHHDEAKPPTTEDFYLLEG
ncbi:MAG: hypothetical protein K2W96_09825, partial [Gemmataceae bacterium]|nr:hypothetical protein [Gemmataceae bacterium]